jgi:hypothetical protein
LFLWLWLVAQLRRGEHREDRGALREHEGRN